MDADEELEQLIRPHLAQTNGQQFVEVNENNGTFEIVYKKFVQRREKGGPVNYHPKTIEIPIEDIHGLIKYIKDKNKLPRRIAV